MSELPPPLPPPSGTARTDDGGDTGWDWDRAKELAEQWFRPLADRDGWLALAYLLASALLAPLLFAATVAFGAVTFALSFVVIGVLLVVPLFAMVGAFTDLELRLAELGGHRIEPRPARDVGGRGVRAITDAVTDPVRWRRVAFVVVNLVLAPLFASFGSLPVSVAVQAVGGGVVAGPWFSIGLGGWAGLGILALPIAAVAAGAIPRVAIWMAGIKAEIDAWFLGTDRLAAAEARASTLATQRQDILDAVASERRRIERNLHDGVQQQLVAIGLDLGMAEQQLGRDPDRARELIGSARDKVQGSIGELRQLGRGLHPAILEDRGIDAALSAVVGEAAIPISVHVDPDLGLSTDVAETVYFVCNEAIANVLKHAQARVASVHVVRVGPDVRITVHDDGVGGVDASQGTGVAGIRARVHAVDGSLVITSPAGGPTTIVAQLPAGAGR